MYDSWVLLSERNDSTDCSKVDSAPHKKTARTESPPFFRSGLNRNAFQCDDEEYKPTPSVSVSVSAAAASPTKHKLAVDAPESHQCTTLSPTQNRNHQQQVEGNPEESMGENDEEEYATDGPLISSLSIRVSDESAQTKFPSLSHQSSLSTRSVELMSIEGTESELVHPSQSARVSMGSRISQSIPLTIQMFEQYHPHLQLQPLPLLAFPPRTK
jgi:hypothetical protein